MAEVLDTLEAGIGTVEAAAELEFGHRYPCVEEGTLIDAEQVEISPGAVLEFYLVPDRSINRWNMYAAAFEIAKTKNDYPDFVLHYVKFEPDLVTVQCSYSPPGGTSGIASPFVFWITLLICLAAFVGAAIAIAHFVIKPVYFLFNPTARPGTMGVTCYDYETGTPLSVPFTFMGKGYETDAFIKDIPPGYYDIVWGDPPAGYWPITPNPQRVTIAPGQNLPVEKAVIPTTMPPPSTGTMIITTTPVEGTICVDGQEVGVGYAEVEAEAPGRYVVTFEPVEGYTTPSPAIVDLGPGDTVTVAGTYYAVGKVPTWVWYVIAGVGATGVGVLTYKVATALKK